MTKRAPQFERIGRDFYPTTDARVVPPLLRHVPPGTRFIEPCAGDGALARLLMARGLDCVFAADKWPSAFQVTPSGPSIAVADAYIPRDVQLLSRADCFITNPPWHRQALHALIPVLAAQLPTWLLFDADWMHTGQAEAVWPMLRRIVSVGRLKWFEGSPDDGKDNCCWYLFDARPDAPGAGTPPVFFPKWEQG